MSEYSNYKYTYTDPTSKGAIQFKLSRRTYNKIIPKVMGIFSRPVAYYYPGQGKIEIQRFDTLTGKILETLFVPVTIFIYGYTEWWESFKHMWRQRTYGSFSTDVFFEKGSNSKYYPKLKKIYDSQQK